MEAGTGNGNGESQEPGVTAPQTDAAPAVEEYEPKFERSGVHRRVLMHVTDEEHVGRGPRNTASRLTQELVEDPYTQFGLGDGAQEYLDDLEASGLVQKRDDGTYGLTEAGHYELTH